MPGTLQDFAQAVHNVVSICRDAEQDFRGAAHETQAPEIKQMFEEYSAQRVRFAVELQDAVKAMGFEATDPQGLGGMVHASWISLKSLVTGHNVHGILVEAERAEDWSLKAYRVALGATLPPDIRAIMERQYQQVQAAHHRIHTLRVSTEPPPETPKDAGISPPPGLSHTNAPQEMK